MSNIGLGIRDIARGANAKKATQIPKAGPGFGAFGGTVNHGSGLGTYPGGS